MDSEPAADGPGRVASRLVQRLVTGAGDDAPDCRELVSAAFAARGVTGEASDWVPVVAVRAALADVERAAGVDAVLALGRRVGVDLDLPSDCDSVPAALAALDDAYRGQHRGDVGGYHFRRIGERDGRVECETLYPCAFDRGLVTGVAVPHTEGPVRLSEVGVCREGAAPRCTYELRW